jgi:hypothetical protein
VGELKAFPKQNSLPSSSHCSLVGALQRSHGKKGNLQVGFYSSPSLVPLRKTLQCWIHPYLHKLWWIYLALRCVFHTLSNQYPEVKMTRGKKALYF